MTFIQLVGEEITGTNSGSDIGTNVAAQRSAIGTDQPPTKKRKTCATSKCRNRTMETCATPAGPKYVANEP